MKRQFAALALALAAAVASPAASPAADPAAGSAAAPAAQAAVTLVEQGAAFLRARGKAELIKRINTRDPLFYRGDLYLHMLDAASAVTLADPVHPSLIGLDLLDVPDAVGRKYRRDIVELAASRGKGWVDYTYKNPADGHFEPGRDYIVRVGDVVLESGLAVHHR